MSNTTVGGSIQNGIFNFNAVQSEADVPQQLREEIRQAFPNTARFGEIPDKNGNVMVGKPTPKECWHPGAVSILRMAHGQRIPV